jgi:hypothetical protein
VIGVHGELLKGSGFEEVLKPFTGVKLAFGVSGIDLINASTFAGDLAAFFEFLEESG